MTAKSASDLCSAGTLSRYSWHIWFRSRWSLKPLTMPPSTGYLTGRGYCCCDKSGCWVLYCGWISRMGPASKASTTTSVQVAAVPSATVGIANPSGNGGPVSTSYIYSTVPDATTQATTTITKVLVSQSCASSGISLNMVMVLSMA